MRLLLDTHAILWWLLGDTSLSTKARDAIPQVDSEVWVSAVCAFEISTKHRIGKLPQAEGLVGAFQQMVRDQGFRELDITMRHASMAGRLPFPHKDPFDRLLVAQAMSEDMTLISNEAVFDSVGVSRLW